jgi:glycerol kinase
VLEAMESDSGIRLEELRVDGGAARNDALMQFQADVLGVPVVRPRMHETTALGAAYLAGLGVGVWESTDQLDAQWRVERVFDPGMSRDARDGLRAGWRDAIARSRDWAKPEK